MLLIKCFAWNTFDFDKSVERHETAPWQWLVLFKGVENLRHSGSAIAHSAIVKKQNQMLPILFWHLDVGRFHAAGIGVSFGCIFSVDGGWAGAIASRLAPTGGFGWGLGFGVGLEVFGAFLCLGQRGRLLGYGAIDQPICSVELPTVLMLLLTFNDCYTSIIDKPTGH
jgi:hypothetical protein